MRNNFRTNSFVLILFYRYAFRCHPKEKNGKHYLASINDIASHPWYKIVFYLWIFIFIVWCEIVNDVAFFILFKVYIYYSFEFSFHMITLILFNSCIIYIWLDSSDIVVTGDSEGYVIIWDIQRRRYLFEVSVFLGEG